MYDNNGVSLDQCLQNTTRQDISSGLRRHFVNNEKILYLQKFIDFVECNISRNNPTT